MPPSGRSRAARRLLIVAAAGYGKSVALDAALPVGARRCTGEEALVADLSCVPAVGVDDLDAMLPKQQVALVRRLAVLPPDVGFVLASRTPLDPAVRMGLRGEILERGPADLLLTPHAVARVLAEEYFLLAPEVAERVFADTAGWPALVHLAADSLCRSGWDPAATSEKPDSGSVAWVTANVLGPQDPSLAEVLRVVAGLGPVTQTVLDRVAAALGVSPLDGAAAQLRDVGLVVSRRSARGQRHDVLVKTVARVLIRAAGELGTSAATYRAAAAAYEEQGLWLAAARALRAAGGDPEVERLIVAHGEAMLRAGEARGVVELLADRQSTQEHGLVLQTYADALRLSGEPGAALRAFRPLVAAADQDRWSPALATGVAAVHHTLGDYAAALETLEQAGCGTDAEDDEEVEWLSWRVRVLAMLGRRPEARPLAVATMRAAERLGTPRAAAAAHLAMARVTDGEAKEAHHEQARLAAEECGDAVTVALVLVNQSHQQLARARFAEAVASSREVVRIAELGFPPGRLVAALHNLAEALVRLGEFDEARWHLQRAIAHARRLGPGATAVGLLGLADIHRQLGHAEQALAAYSEAVSLARRSRENQVLVPALAGLARQLAAGAPEEARATAEEAYRLSTPSVLPYACLALSWVAIAQGDRATAARGAAEAVDASSAILALDLLAESLELTAECSTDDKRAVAALEEAREIWRTGGAVPAEARIEVLLGALTTADATARSHAREAIRVLQHMGISQVNGRPLTAQWTDRTVAISVLGGFSVLVDGAPVPLTAWRSRQARTLVKILTARRGRPVTRSSLRELLWPDDDPAKTGHRLSVLLATVRGVLDPEKRWPAERYIGSDLTGVWLDLSRTRIDAEDLISDAQQAADLVAAGDDERASEILADIDRRYIGDAFEDEPDADWADGLREEARSAWMRSARLLVSARNRAGRAGDSLPLLVRLLAVDPYDEQTHRLLVRALLRTGRHGEARRAFDRWTDAMRAIDAPLPGPSVLEAVGTPSIVTPR